MAVIPGIVDALLSEAKSIIRRYVRKLVRDAVKLALVVLVSIWALLIGLSFMLVGLVRFLGQFLDPSLAWGVVGGVFFVIGGVSLMVATRGKGSG